VTRAAERQSDSSAWSAIGVVLIGPSRSMLMNGVADAVPRV
jgi:hypothetical protein